MEQLSKFMGHTLQTHCNYYRMSDKVYQKAQISKLLNLMMEGGVEEFKGKTLEEINIDLSPIGYDENVGNLNSYPVDNPDCEMPSTSAKVTKKIGEAKKVMPPKQDKRESWTKTQKNTLQTFFSDHIKLRKAPTEREITELSEKYPQLFKGKKWTSIKAIVYNM